MALPKIREQIEARVKDTGATMTGRLVQTLNGNPCYELIGKSNGIAKDWNVDVKINSNKNLEITTFGLPTSYIDETYVKWLINIEMNKVFDKE